MAIFISMLRGINVGGQKKIKMAQLAPSYEALELRNVETYIQGGNVIFDTSQTDPGRLSAMIGQKIREMLSIDIAVLIRTPSELNQIIRNNPFLKEKGVDESKLHITFLSNAPTESALSQIKETKDKSDSFVLLNREVYLYLPGGYGKTKFSNDFFERKLGVAATTRNWRTVKTLLDIANGKDRVKGT